MKILSNKIIKDHYDVVIIGAGNGGLTTGALLANRGIDVLLIDQHYLPGGCVSSIRRMDVTCDVGAAIMFGFTPGGWHPQLELMNHIDEPVDLVLHDKIFTLHWPEEGKVFGPTIDFGTDFEKFFKDLTAVFPANKKGLEKLYKFLFKAHRAFVDFELPMGPGWQIGEISLKKSMKIFFKSPLETMRLMKLMLLTGKQVFDKYLTDEDDIEKLYDMCTACFTCTKLENTPAVICVAMFADMHKGGACYPVGSPQAFPNTLERAIERMGGTILYRNMVDNILFKPDRKTAYGVRLSDGTEITANQIVSDANIYQLYGNLIPAEYIKPKKMKRVQSLVPTAGAALLYMAVDKKGIPPEYEKIESWIENINESLGNNFVFMPSMDDPSICPDDVHSITVFTGANPDDWPRPWDPEYKSEVYEKKKEALKENILGSLEKYYPDMRRHIRFCEVATPSTIERFTLKHKGSIGGPALNMENGGLLGRPGCRTEFKNLYLCGDSAQTGEGIVSTCVSGFIAANNILARAKYGKPYSKDDLEGKENVVRYHKPGSTKRAPIPADDEALTEVSAKRLAMQCQWCEENVEGRGTCRPNCPAGIDVLNFMRRIEAGNYNSAAKEIREMNPFGEVCGAVCPAERLCESDCYRLTFDDRSAQIRRLQQWVCEKAGSEGWERHVPEQNGKKVAVVGAGPAGLSCAYFLARLGYKIDIYDKDSKAGGIPAQMIPGFRLDNEIVNRDLNGIISYPGITLKLNTELGRDVRISDLAGGYDSVFIAPGLGKGKMPDLPGAEKADVKDAVSFLKEYNTTGKADVEGKTVLVIGGGSVATDVAGAAKRSGAEKVMLCCLESRDQMPALKSEIDDIISDGCELNCSLGPLRFDGSKLILAECSSVFDSSGCFAPELNKDNTREIEFDLAVLAVGQEAEKSCAEYLAEEFGPGGIEIDPDTQLVKGRKNIYAGGDITREGGTIAHAVGDGRRAAAAIHGSLEVL